MGPRISSPSKVNVPEADEVSVEKRTDDATFRTGCLVPDRNAFEKPERTKSIKGTASTFMVSATSLKTNQRCKKGKRELLTTDC